MLNEVMKSWKVLFATILTGLGLTLAPLFSATAVTYQIDAKQSVDKSTASVGDILTYTIEITNVGDTMIDPVFISETLSPYVTYVAGSSAWSDSLGASGTLDDSFGTNGDHNLGVLNPEEWVKVTFQAKVKSGVTAGTLIESVAQIKKTWKEGNEWFQCAARTTVQGEVLGEVLPETGPANVIATSVFLAYLGFLVRRIKLYRYL